MDPVEQLGYRFSFARGVVDGRPAGIDRGEELFESEGISWTGMQTCAWYDRGIPFCDAYVG